MQMFSALVLGQVSLSSLALRVGELGVLSGSEEPAIGTARVVTIEKWE